MKGIVLKEFHDKYHFNTVYQVGAEVDFEKSRLGDVVSRGLVRKAVATEEIPDEEAKTTDTKVDTEVEKAVEAAETEKPVDEAKADELSSEESERAKSEEEAAQKIAKARGRKSSKKD